MRIDFYVLETVSGQKALLFACQLLEKAYAAQKQVYVHTNSREEAERLDALLWTYRDDSFVPHNLYVENEEFPPLVQIGWNDNQRQEGLLLINLAKDIPSSHQQFKEMIEIVFADPVVQQLARTRYKQYRDQGFDINTIKLKTSEI